MPGGTVTLHGNGLKDYLPQAMPNLLNSHCPTAYMPQRMKDCTKIPYHGDWSRFCFLFCFLRIATIFAAIMEFTSNILTSSNQQKSFYLMLIICHTRIKVNIIVTILYHFIHLVSISVTAILRYPPLFHFAILHRRGGAGLGA